MNKKAISPLISTVVLIVFAGTLGVVVISWGNSEVQSSALEDGCDKVGLSLVYIDGVPKICQRESEIELIARNDGDVNLVGLKVIAIGENDIARAEINKDILSGDIAKEKVTLTDVGAIKKIMITPKTLENNKERFCPKKSVDIENIGLCN